MDTLKLSDSSSLACIENCSAKVRHFCQHDAFSAYDVVGQQNEHESTQFQPALLGAMNRAMKARSSRKAWEPFLNRYIPELAAIPTDFDLIEGSDADYVKARDLLRFYYLAMTNVTWITDMAASKMLYLKRPRLAAISDSYVREALCIHEPDTTTFPWRSAYCAERALRVSNTVRAIGISNMELLNRLQREMLPTFISKARLVDILVWADMAKRADHSTWGKQAFDSA
jgi:hypothetical protein